MSPGGGTRLVTKLPTQQFRYVTRQTRKGQTGDTTSSVTRRGVLTGLAGGVTVLTAVSQTTGAQDDSDSGERYYLTQGDTCYDVTPLSGTTSVEDFYDWNRFKTDYSSEGTVSLQRPNTSVLFLYEDPEGTVSLVVVHDKFDGGSDGGAVTFVVWCMSRRTEWMLKDDLYGTPSNVDRWGVNGGSGIIDWTWDGGRTDGGVLSPVTERTTIYIKPLFNEAARLYREVYFGDVNNFELLTGDRSDPDRIELDMSRQLEIGKGRCQ